MRAKRASIDRSTSSAFVSQRGRERRTFIQRSSFQLASTVTNARISRSGGARNRPSTPRAITVGSAQAASTTIPPSRRERRTRMAAAMTAIPDTSPSMSGSTVGVADCKAGMPIASAPSRGEDADDPAHNRCDAEWKRRAFRRRGGVDGRCHLRPLTVEKFRGAG
jgi:hypothetical protein